METNPVTELHSSLPSHRHPLGEAFQADELEMIAWLLQSTNDEDLQIDGSIVESSEAERIHLSPSSTSEAQVYRLIQLCRVDFHFVLEVIYIYNQFHLSQSATNSIQRPSTENEVPIQNGSLQPSSPIPYQDQVLLSVSISCYF